jgi:DNA-directed RNA polymerase specialized sigma24 family protein
VAAAGETFHRSQSRAERARRYSPRQGRSGIGPLAINTSGPWLDIIHAPGARTLSDPRPQRAGWQLSQQGFARFLRTLDSDEAAAAERYEILRLKLVRFFEWRGGNFPEAHADETLNRVIRKIEQGEEIRDPHAYCYGAARLVLLEALKRQAKEQDAAHEYHRIALPQEDSDDLEDRLRCLRRCMNELPAGQRDLVSDYYQGSGTERIDGRRRLADSLGIGMNALRIRAFRLTGKLQECVTGCLQPPGAPVESGFSQTLK